MGLVSAIFKRRGRTKSGSKAMRSRQCCNSKPAIDLTLDRLSVGDAVPLLTVLSASQR
jgi:hypothetical protein